MNIKAILLDIEGTVGPVTFVHQVLFPISAKKIPEFLRDYKKNQIDEEIVALQKTLDDQDLSNLNESKNLENKNSSSDSLSKNPSTNHEPYSIDRMIELLLHYIKIDKKDTILKSIQGKIWKQSFESGEIKAALYPDVAPALKQWKQEGKSISIFSSGSIQAQKLYFKHSDSGDLSSYIDSYFDTVTGPKKEAATYIKIALTLGFDPKEILFLTDMEAEAEAALIANVQVKILNREGNLSLINPKLSSLVVPDFSFR